MKAVLGVIAVIGLVVVGALLFAFSKRNSIIDLNQKAEVASGNLESAYQRRLDLVPNLVATVEGATKYEAATLEKIVASRNTMLGVVKEIRQAKLDSNDPAQLERYDKLNSELFASLRAFTGVATEAYPNLKATESFRDLMSQIEGTENRINTARRDFNTAAGDYNSTVQKWGFLPFCGGWKERGMFKSDTGAKDAPKVKF